jgi:hypothetical protein
VLDTGGVASWWGVGRSIGLVATSVSDLRACFQPHHAEINSSLEWIGSVSTQLGAAFWIWIGDV